MNYMNSIFYKKKKKKKKKNSQEQKFTRKGERFKTNIYPEDRDVFIQELKDAGNLTNYGKKVGRSLEAVRQYMKRLDPPVTLREVFPNCKAVFVQDLENHFVEMRQKAVKKSKVKNMNDVSTNYPFDVKENGVPIEVRYSVLRMKKVATPYVFDIKEINTKARWTVLYVFNKDVTQIKDIDEDCKGVLIFSNKNPPFESSTRIWKDYKDLFHDISVLGKKNLYSKGIDLRKLA